MDADLEKEPEGRDGVAKRPPPPLWVRLAGWTGAMALLGSFFLVSQGHLQARGLYLAMNAAGAAGIALLAWKKRAWLPLGLAAAWLAIGAWGLWRLVV